MVPDEFILAVCGARMDGLALNHHLRGRGGDLVERTFTSDAYRLHALDTLDPPRPGLIRVAPGAGAQIEVELWRLSAAALGQITAEIDLPLAIGTVCLCDGRRVTGFVCEGIAAQSASDITHLGGWRAHLARPPALTKKEGSPRDDMDSRNRHT